MEKKNRFDRDSKNLKQKRIKSKPIQQKNSIKSNISYPNLKNRKKKQCTVPNRCSVYHSASFSISFSMSQASSSLYFITSLFLDLSLFHRLSLFLTQNTNLLIKTKSDPKYQFKS